MGRHRWMYALVCIVTPNNLQQSMQLQGLRVLQQIPSV